MARVLFFGRLRDVAGAAEMAHAGGVSLSALQRAVTEGNPALDQALSARGVRVAINHALVAAGDDRLITAGDEVAFMPPASGG
jgi:molybdopterin converting factor small subunit